jgi:hypothetical protein
VLHSQRKRADRARHSRLYRGARQLSSSDAELACRIIDGCPAVYVDGTMYALYRDGDAVAVQRFGADAHRIIGGVCSCPDNKFRHRPCKHLRTLEALRCV